MSLIVSIKVGSGHYKSEACYCGYEIPFGTENIEHVTADGKELEYIRSEFTGIRMKRNSVSVVFFGDDAKFIVENWT